MKPRVLISSPGIPPKPIAARCGVALARHLSQLPQPMMESLAPEGATTSWGAAVPTSRARCQGRKTWSQAQGPGYRSSAFAASMRRQRLAFPLAQAAWANKSVNRTAETPLLAALHRFCAAAGYLARWAS